jgi:hypothetical protein
LLACATFEDRRSKRMAGVWSWQFSRGWIEDV